jgi:hypothetical protein
MTQQVEGLSSPRPANLPVAKTEAAIRRLSSLIAELQALPTDEVSGPGDPKVLAIQSFVQATLEQIFGPDTTDFDRLRPAWNIDPRTLVRIREHGRLRYANSRDFREAVRRNQDRALALLQQEIVLLETRLDDEEDSQAERAIRAYSNLDLHPEIARAASVLYRHGHYANAIEDAVKALNALVRLCSGLELDGTALMQSAFSPKPRYFGSTTW